MKLKKISYFYCRTEKKVVVNLEEVVDTYFIIDEKCKLNKTKTGFEVMVQNFKEAGEYAKNMGWMYPVWSKSFEPTETVLQKDTKTTLVRRENV